MKYLINLRELDEKQKQWERDQWSLDAGESFARLEVTPFWRGGELRYDIESELKIRPYPNPFSYGGFWGSQTTPDKEAVKARIKSFKDEVKAWKKAGLSNVQVVWHPELTEAEYKLKREAELLKFKLEMENKREQKTLF